eukprot:COSAG02_NODE_1102_length_14571_cov_27.965243_15_plen_172_part_00
MGFHQACIDPSSNLRSANDAIAIRVQAPPERRRTQVIVVTAPGTVCHKVGPGTQWFDEIWMAIHMYISQRTHETADAVQPTMKTSGKKMRRMSALRNREKGDIRWKCFHGPECSTQLRWSKFRSTLPIRVSLSVLFGDQEANQLDCKLTLMCHRSQEVLGPRIHKVSPMRS